MCIIEVVLLRPRCATRKPSNHTFVTVHVAFSEAVAGARAFADQMETGELSKGA